MILILAETPSIASIREPLNIMFDNGCIRIQKFVKHRSKGIVYVVVILCHYHRYGPSSLLMNGIFSPVRQLPGKNSDILCMRDAVACQTQSKRSASEQRKL